MTETGPTDAFHEQSSQTNNCPGYSYDQKSAGHGFMIAWEESVKYMEESRQLQELEAQQQPRAQLWQVENIPAMMCSAWRTWEDSPLVFKLLRNSLSWKRSLKNML